MCIARTFSHSVACIFIIFRRFWWKILNFNLDQFLNLRCFFVVVLVMKSFTTPISWKHFSIFSSKSLIFQTLTCRVMAHLELILYLMSGEGSFLIFYKEYLVDCGRQNEDPTKMSWSWSLEPHNMLPSAAKRTLQMWLWNDQFILYYLTEPNPTK